jgi:ATP-binding cassette subfamily F protein uup
VSHDREFLNNVATSTLVFEGPGEVREYAGGYDDWLVQRAASATVEEPQAEEPPPRKPAERSDKRRPAADRPRRLSYSEKRELASLPARIETLETRQRELHEKMADPAFYQQDRRAIVEVNAELESVQSELAAVYARWESLESLAQ